MTGKFAHVTDLSRGDWLRTMDTDSWSGVMSTVPPGFAAYARVFHFVERERPSPGKTWQDYKRAASIEELETLLTRERTTWAQTARSFGTTMHAAAQFHRLVRRTPYDTDELDAPDGWHYSAPEEGNLREDALTTLAKVLAQHTTTPDAGIAAIWEGWGGLLDSQSSVTLTATFGGEPSAQAHESAITSGAQDSPMPLGQSSNGSGILPPEIAAGPRFSLFEDIGINYILFQVGVSDLVDPTWPKRAPWAGKDQFWIQSPSILWPDDHTWTLATDIDSDSTLVAGSVELINELLGTPGIEALSISPHADLSWAGDTVNPSVG